MNKCRWALVIGFIVLSVLIFAYGFYHLSKVTPPLTVKEVFSLQLSFTKIRFVHIIKQWQDQGVLTHFMGHFKYDFIYLIGYSLLMTSLFVLLGCLLKNPNIKQWSILPISAGILDSIENTIEIAIIKNYSFNALLIFIHSMAATLKFLFVAIAIVVIIWFMVKYALHGPHRDD